MFFEATGLGDMWHDDTCHVTHSMVTLGIMRAMVRGMHEEDGVVAKCEW